jgi:hypothetical protein
MSAQNAAALVVRPDGIVFAAAGPGEPLSMPPLPAAPAPLR